VARRDPILENGEERHVPLDAADLPCPEGVPLRRAVPAKIQFTSDSLLLIGTRLLLTGFSLLLTGTSLLLTVTSLLLTVYC